MDWLLLLLLVVLLLLLVYLVRGMNGNTTRGLQLANGDVWLPANKYYGGMLTDLELELRPVLDVAMPLTTFRTVSDGTVQLVNLYNYDHDVPMGGKSLSFSDEDGNVAVGNLLQAFLTSALSETQANVQIVRWRKVAEYGVRATARVATELHDFLFTFLPLADKFAPPRRAVKNVGYFSQPVVINQQQIDIIQRYRRTRVVWQPTSSIPVEWYPELRAALVYWNQALEQVQGPQLIFVDSPWIGNSGDPSVNLFCLAHSTGYIGVGTTVVDSRNGEHLWSRIHIDPLSLNRQAYLFPSQNNPHLHLLRYAVTHELGHTLALRHNFVAQADGYSSYMAYMPVWYPDEQGKLHFLKSEISGTYDRLAIKYGYQTVANEDPMRVPAVLQQEIDKHQRLFHTDENVDQDQILSQVHRHSMKDALEAPGKWMKAFALYRSQLFEDPKEHLRDVRRTYFFLTSLTESIVNMATYVGGYKTDYHREYLEADDHTASVIGNTVEFLIGDAWNLGKIENYLTSATVDEQGQVTFTERPWEGSYTLDRISVINLHASAVIAVAHALLAPQRVAALRDPGTFLLRLLTTPGTQSKRPIVSTQMSPLQLQTMTGIFSTVEYYRPNYPTTVQASFDTMMDHLTMALKGEQHRSLLDGVVRTVRTLQEKTPARKVKTCGGHPRWLEVNCDH